MHRVDYCCCCCCAVTMQQLHSEWTEGTFEMERVMSMNAPVKLAVAS